MELCEVSVKTQSMPIFVLNIGQRDLCIALAVNAYCRQNSNDEKRKKIDLF